MFLFMILSVDGYFEGPNHDLSWHNVDEEFNDFAVEQLDEADTLIFGRRTYDLMAGYWPSEQATGDDPGVAKRMNGMRKIVFSSSLASSDWTNTDIHSENPGEVIGTLKNQPGKDLAVLGSSNLCLTLLKENLLDEVRIMISPIVLGKGTSLFEGLDHPYKLKLTKSREFDSGNVLNYYTVKT
jgi:dihydrofolate reductase